MSGKVSFPAATIERVIASQPTNRVAAQVIGRGEHWTPARPLKTDANSAWQATPLPTVPFRSETAPSGTNMIGRRVGRLTVVGYAGRGRSTSGTKGARWVVRCSCGNYGHQRTAFLKSEHATVRGMCPACDYLEQLKAGRVAVVDGKFKALKT